MSLECFSVGHSLSDAAQFSSFLLTFAESWCHRSKLDTVQEAPEKVESRYPPALTLTAFVLGNKEARTSTKFLTQS